MEVKKGRTLVRVRAQGLSVLAPTGAHKKHNFTKYPVEI
jgi:hypothetical protein